MILQDKVVVLAGLGPGLGAALARRAVDEGAKLVLAARTEEKLAAAATELGGDVLTVRTDVNDESAVRNLLEKTVEKLTTEAPIASPAARPRAVARAQAARSRRSARMAQA